MRFSKILSTLFFFAAGLCLLPSTAGADGNVQRRSMLTVVEPTEIPGMVLPAGTYTVSVLDYKNGKEMVQFSNADDTKIIANVLAIRDRRVRTDDGQTGFIFFQRLEGSPIALKSWYYSGDEWGEMFAYPKSKAIVIAAATHQEVVATPAESNPTLQAEVTVIKPEETPKPEAKPVVEPVVEKAAEAAPAPAEKAPTHLPKTGSNVPLFGLIGLGALAGAAALHLSRRLA